MHYILFHNSFDKIAGTERVLYNIMEYLSTRPETRLTLLLGSPEKALALSLDQFPLNIVYLNEVGKSSRFLDVLQYHKNLYIKLLHYFKGIPAHERQVCIATNPVLAAIAYYAGRRTIQGALEVISCEHFALEVSGMFSKAIRKLLYKKVSVVALTKGDQDKIIAGYQPKLCVCIPNAIPFPLKHYAYSSSKKTILAIGRLTAQKGFDLLINAFAMIADKFPDWTLNIVGDDYGDQQMLQGLIDQLQLKNVQILAATRQINAHYESSAFFVLSSRFEGLPMVLLEAMGYGLPIVAFNCPTGPAELVDDSNGYLVNNGDLAELANCMEQLIMDKAILLNKASGAEQRAKAYTAENINKLWETFLNEITHDK